MITISIIENGTATPLTASSILNHGVNVEKWISMQPDSMLDFLYDLFRELAILIANENTRRKER